MVCYVSSETPIELNNQLCRNKQLWFEAFSDFCGVNTLTTYNFRLRLWWNWARMLNDQFYETVQVVSSTPLCVPLNHLYCSPFLPASLLAPSILPSRISPCTQTDLCQSLSHGNTAFCLATSAFSRVTRRLCILKISWHTPCHWRHPTLAPEQGWESLGPHRPARERACEPTYPLQSICRKRE